MSKRGTRLLGGLKNKVEYETNPEAAPYIQDVRYRRSDGAAVLLRYGRPVAHWYITPSQERSLREGKGLRIMSSDLAHWNTYHYGDHPDPRLADANYDAWISAHLLRKKATSHARSR